MHIFTNCFGLLFLLLFLISNVYGQFTIRMRSNPAGCIGGEVCIFQPSVAVYNFLGQVAVTYKGSASVALQTSPTGFESLYSRECSYNGCGPAVSGSSVSAPFVNGIAQFNNLTLQTAGSGYTLSFTGRDAAGIAFGSTISSSFSVDVGGIYKTQFHTFLGHTLGGEVFAPQPVIAIADRGGNVVSSASGYKVTASLTGPSSTLLPLTQLTATFNNGLAQYNGLYINMAGDGYVMIFKTDLGSLISVPTLYSTAFSVGVGVPAALQFVAGHHVTDNPKIYGGEFFIIAPRVRIVDAGGNLVIDDSSSGVKVTITNNPAGGQILPTSSQFQVADKGIVSFPSLRITTIGNGYVLGFALYSYSALGNSFTVSNPLIQLLTDTFQVYPGLPRKLAVTKQASRAYSGGQAFNVQPVIEIRDYGDNAVNVDYTSVVRASMIPSLSAGSDIRLQADQQVTVYITNISTPTPPGTYGAGEHIFIDVKFLYEVWLTLEGTNRPYLMMNPLDPNGYQRSAYLYGGYSRMETLRFRYIVHPGDDISALDLTALMLNGSTIRDGNRNVPLLDLPRKLISDFKTITINTAQPVAIALNTTTASGEYGAGHAIEFFVTFSMPVAVGGTPWLVLNVPRTSNGVPKHISHKMYNVTYLNSSTTLTRNQSYYHNYTVYFAYAEFDRLSDDYTVVFRYQVAQGDFIQQVLFANDIYLNNSESWIRRKSTVPTTAVNYSVAALRSTFANASVIVIDTAPPKLNHTYGVQCDHNSGEYYAGEVFLITVQFDKPIAIYGIDFILYMECGTGEVSTPCPALYNQLLSDQKTMEFKLTAPALVNASRLDIVYTGTALQLPSAPYYIRRLSTHPTTPVDTNTTAVTLFGHSLGDIKTIRIYGFVPVVSYTTMISVNATYNISSGVLYPGDFVDFGVRFTTKVVTSCDPVVIIVAGLSREAVYVSGNKTNTFVFRYTVGLGDNSAGLSYRFQPNALCYESGCPKTTSCTVKAYSTLSNFNADLSMPIGNGDRVSGIPIDSSLVIVGTPVGRNTTIKKITVDSSDGIYGAGSIVYFTVTFTDDVIYTSANGIAAPMLHLNIGRYASYSGGSGSKIFSFYYILQEADSTNSFLLSVNASSGNVFSCDYSAGCIIRNRNSQIVSEHSPVSIVTNAVIKVDTSAPTVLHVSTSKPTSPYYGRYTTGELIEILIVYSQPVHIVGLPPRLIMNTSNPSGQQYAYYDINSSNKTHLIFKYLVVEGDYSPNLMYLVNYIDMNNEQAIIYRAGEVPVTVADNTLPVVTTLSTTGQVIRIDTKDVPKVSKIYALQNNRTFRAGDWFQVYVEFSQYVICTGAPVLFLNLGDRVGKATFVNSLTVGNVTGYPTEPMTLLTFNYFVQALDFNFDLDYIDQFSLDPGITPLGGPGVIYAASTYPTQHAELDLALPNTPGSLGYNSDVYVDGRLVYETSIEIVSGSGTYGVGSNIYIRMNFSADVVVLGKPYIVMETGEYDRPAQYVGGSGTNSLYFLLVPQPGDFSASLDYAIDKEKLSSAAASFHINGRIVVKSMNPTHDVSIFLNPVGGVLKGTLQQKAAVGVAPFRDLTIDIFGPDYQLLYLSHAVGARSTLQVSQTLFVSFSSQFDLVPKQGLKGDAAGWAVAVSGDIVVVGAPNSNVSETTIQTVTTTGFFSPPEPEVNTITTVIKPQPGIQTFHTTADVGETVGGYFTLTYGLSGTSRPFPANINTDMLSVLLGQDFPGLGNITATREPYIFCACQNAFTWTLTFNDRTMGSFYPFTVNTKALTGAGVSVVGPHIVQSPARLGGGFTLSALGKTSRLVPVEAKPADISVALADIGLTFLDISITPTDESLARSWIVTFDAYSDFYEIPTVTVDYSKLTGGDCKVVVVQTRKGMHGPSGLGGYFQLKFRGNTTDRLVYNATADDVKYALEALPTINMVNVNRSLPSTINGYTWTIEFVEVNHWSPRGYVVDLTSNVEPIEPINHLIGTNTQINVGAVWGMDEPISFFDAFRQGTYGSKAGAVYVFQKTIEQYVQVATIHGEDTNENDQFGYSVDIDGDLMIVGAVSADKNGVPEKQAIYCSATSGSFVIGFRGWTSDPIPASANIEVLTDAMKSSATGFGKLHNIKNIYIEDWGDGSICDNNTAVITFFSPVDGAPNLFNGVDTGPNLELMTIQDNSLINIYKNNSHGIVQMLEIQNGTIRVHGSQADAQQIGSAYIFRASYNCPTNVTICYKKTWIQEAQFFPTFNTNQPTKFGYSVAINNTIAVVGAPGDESGSVYVYEFTAGVWKFLQRITVAELEVGDSLGYSLAVYQSTIVIGAPFFSNSTGKVVVYKRPASGGIFSMAQSLVPSLVLYPLAKGDLFGSSVSVNGDIAVVGSAGRDATAIYTGILDSTDPALSTGIVYIFSRVSSTYDFFYEDVLVPTNVRNLDRFGWSVAIDGDFILASSMEEYRGDLLANRVIMEVTTTSAYIVNDRLGGYFNLEWIYTNVTSGKWRTARTRSIPYDIEAADLKVILEEDLYTGDLIVTRSNMDVYDKGFSWTITFMEQTRELPPLVGDPTDLNGFNASIAISIVNQYPSLTRGVTHIFQRSRGSRKYVEQAFLSPMMQQNMDRCGWQVALDGDNAVVGCPNRDGIVPNTNSGSAMVYSLTLLHVTFIQSDVSIPEGQSITLDIKKTSSNVENVDVLFYVTTIDRNSESTVQDYVQYLFGIEDSSIPYPSTACDVVGVSGLAVARSQFYGSTHNESVWIDGMFDYRGISDYVPINAPRAYLISSLTISQNITTTGDSILEKPDEKFVVSLNSPGLWPSMLGSLQIKVTILDNGDGFGSDFSYDKMYEEEYDSGNEFGGAVAINQKMKVLFSSAPLGYHQSVDDFGVVTKTKETGYVIQYQLFNGSWVFKNKIYSPVICQVCHFGDEVKVAQIQNRTESLLAVGEPGVNKVHIYYSSVDNFGKSWVYEKTLSRAEAFLPNHMFGAFGSVAMNNDVVVVGAAGVESIFIFYRMYSNLTSSWYWTSGQLLRSSNYDYDLINGVIHLHRQHFGKSVSMSERTIAVGAPFADYGKLGTDLVEVNWDTEGTDIRGYGRGKVYIFTCIAAVQEITVIADATLSAGTFRLQYTYGGITDISSQIPFSASNETVAMVVDDLYYLDNVIVSVSVHVAANSVQTTSWRITFINEFQNPPLFVPVWAGYGCSECIPFSSNYSVDHSQQVTVKAISSQTSFSEVNSFSAFDKVSGMKFGWTTALDGNQLLVGAIHSPSVTTTTWDFEAGTLLGWSTTGTAFKFQPTFGDNPYLRTTYPSVRYKGLLNKGERSGMVGRYFIGTYEMRPGDSSDWRVPNSNYPQGSYQGDSPVGTLTSDVFLILGSKITLLIGGGCDYYKEYVELLVDGFSVQKHTGDCTERMQRKAFDVSTYMYRAAQIRIVDDSQSMWGHINVDDFRFDWDVSGARLTSSNSRVSAGGKIEAPKSGAVYGFLRHITGSLDLCFSDTTQCEWSEEIKLTPSDKRANMLFGSSIVLNDPLGIAVIGAPGAECSGIYKEIQSVYPYEYDNGTSNAAGLHFPLDPQMYMPSFESVPNFAPQSSGANGVWQARVDNNVNPNILAAMRCGAAYLFVRKPAKLGPRGEVVIAQRWTNTEMARFQAPDAFAGDSFSQSMDLSQLYYVAGAPGQDGVAKNAGSVYSYSLAFASLYFDVDEFFALQGTDSFATVTVRRNTAIYSGEMEIAYATSDLTAKGVDMYKYAACLSLSPAQRGPAGCGDYEQTQGNIYFREGANSGGFTINIINYRCARPFLKFIQVTLSVPGSGVIQGETFTAKVRIDDNNFLYQNCLELY